jgi:hypothetical protein
MRQTQLERTMFLLVEGVVKFLESVALIMEKLAVLSNLPIRSK